MNNLLIGQSGGPTSVINASVVGSILEARLHNEIDRIYGAHYGLDGIINEDLILIDDKMNVEEWMYTPGAILGSVRFKIDEYPNDLALYERILTIFKKYDIRYFIYIGGNDSMDTSRKISDYFKKINFDCKVIGLPKTIDNDLVETHFCPGYPSAAKFVAVAIEEIYHDLIVYKEGRVTIVEIMGRDAGWLTAAAKIPSINGVNVDLIYLPEKPFNMDDFLNKVKSIYDKKKMVLVCVSEGIVDDKKEYILKHREFKPEDDFGHLQLGGVSLVLAEKVKKYLNLPVRAIELNLLQRCSMHLASKTDLKIAKKSGMYGVRMMLKGKSDFIVSINFKNNHFSFKMVPLIKVATLVNRFPLEWIKGDSDINDDYLNYILPLIKGEIKLKYQNNLPHFTRIIEK